MIAAAQVPGAPPRPIERLTRPFARFLALESASGLLLLGCTIVALALANSPWREAYRAFWSLPATVAVGGFSLSYPLWYWVNDGLMTLFFW
jgi:NhaA family Na+:H+ antiporter